MIPLPPAPPLSGAAMLFALSPVVVLVLPPRAPFLTFPAKHPVARH
jgi:hypothetical protein